MMALIPKTTIIFSAKGTLITVPDEAFTCFCISSHLKKTNSKKAILQMNVNLDKNLNTPINKNQNKNFNKEKVKV